MYSEHQPVISDYALDSEENFARVLKFVLFTIRQSLTEATNQSRGEQEANLFGYKLKAYEEIERDVEKILEDCLRFNGQENFPAVLERLTRMHGFGLVKAGFVCQLVFGFGGCIDSHNMVLYGIDRKQLRIDGIKSHKKRLDKCREYLALCEKLGGSEILWDNWCEYVAQQQPNTFESAYDVSELHVIGTIGVI